MSALHTSMVNTLARDALGFAFLGITDHLYKPQGCEPQGSPDLGGEFYIDESSAFDIAKLLKCPMIPPKYQKVWICVYLAYITTIVPRLQKTYHRPPNGFCNCKFFCGQNN